MWKNYPNPLAPPGGVSRAAVCGSSPCRNRHVSGIRGERVTLELGLTGISSAIWEVCNGDGKRHLIAKTLPWKPVEVLDLQYNGRLFNKPDGSLVINQLAMEDQGIYSLESFDVEGKHWCEQRYNLTVTYRRQSDEALNPVSPRERFSSDLPCRPKSQAFDHDRRQVDEALNPVSSRESFSSELPCLPKPLAFDHDTSSPTPCRSRHVMAIEGEQVTLRLDQVGITSTTWEVCDGKRNFIANTFPGSRVEIRDHRYGGRLSSTQDGSLVIAKLTVDDQGIYNADLFVKVWRYRCDQRYNLTVIQRVPVTPKVAEGNVDSDFPCPSKDEGRKPNEEPGWKSYTTVNIIRLALSLGIFIIALFVLINHLKTEVL